MYPFTFGQDYWQIFANKKLCNIETAERILKQHNGIDYAGESLSETLILLSTKNYYSDTSCYLFFQVILSKFQGGESQNDSLNAFPN